MKRYRISLTDKERVLLKGKIKECSSKSAYVRRSYILLAADEQGDKCWTDKQISKSYGMSISCIERLRERFVEDGLQIALKGKKREPLPEKVLDGRVEARLIALRCSDPPTGYQHWSLRLLADRMVSLEYVSHISHESVRQLLKKRH